MIPKVVVQYWDQESIPKDVSLLMESWKKINPEYDYKLFGKSSAKEFLIEYYGEKGVKIFDAADIPAMRSDIFRVAYILQFGGVYIDAATRSVKNIGLALGDSEKLHLMRKWHGGVWNGFIAAPPNHPVMNEIWTDINKNVNGRVSNDVWAVTGPGVFNEIVDVRGDRLETIKVSEQSDLKKFFQLVNDLEHKKKNHWSMVQKGRSIFKVDEGAVSEDAEKHTDSRPAAQEVIVHLGPHKTGTTSFQNLLERNEERLLRAGYSLITVRSGCSASYKSWRIDYTKVLQGYLLGKRTDSDTLAELTRLFSELEQICSYPDSKALIISDENLLGPTPGHYFAARLGREKSFYSAHALVFKAVKQAFNSKRLRVLVCKREFSDFMSSTYRDLIFKMTITERPSVFVSSLDPSIKECFERFYALFESEFSSSGKVLSFSEFISGMSKVILDEINVAVNEESISSNQSPGWRAVELALGITPLIDSDKERAEFSRFLANRIKGGGEQLKEEMAASLAKLR